MAWLQVDQTIRDHHKICDAAEELKVTPAHLTGCLVLFWLWALDNAPDGSLAGISPGAIARAAQWEGDKLEFIEVLQDHGLLDLTPEGLTIHDWHDYAGNLIERRKADAERKRKARAEKREQEAIAEMSARTSDGHPTNIHTQSRVDQTKAHQSIVPRGLSPPIFPKGERAGDTSDGTPAEVDLQFSEFWNAYPKKVGKASCLKAWKKLKPTAELHDHIMAALEDQKRSEQWQRDGGRFIPNPLTWLNQGRWDDEPAEVVAITTPASGTGGTLATLRRMYKAEGGNDV